MFNFGDNVDRNTVDKVKQAGDSRLSTNPATESLFLSPVLAIVAFVASVYRASVSDKIFCFHKNQNLGTYCFKILHSCLLHALK